MKPENMLRYLLRTYDAINKNITSTKNRLKSILPDADPAHHREIADMESIKGKLSRRIAKELELYDIWTDWMKHIDGIGPFVAGNLVMLYYFRHIAICDECGADLVDFECPECGAKAKGLGNLKFRIEERDFANISKWWKFMGVHCDETGRKPFRSKGKQADWSTPGRAVAFQIGDQFGRKVKDESHLYGQFLLRQKAKHQKKHPEPVKREGKKIRDYTDGHVLRMAKNEASKLFLAHFWIVARTIDGKEVTQPYAGTIMGHTGILDPFYFDHPVEYSNKLRAVG